jgi:hypothetical protein
MGRRTATPDAASVGPSNDRRAGRRVASLRRGGRENPDATSMADSNDRRGAPRMASSRKAAAATPGAISAVRNSGGRTARRGASATTGPGTIGRALVARVPMALAPMAPTPAASTSVALAPMAPVPVAPASMAPVPMPRVPACRGRRGSVARGMGRDNHIRHARARMTKAAETPRPTVLIAGSTIPPTRRAARFGSMDCMRSLPRSPTRHAGCVASC